MKNGWNLRMDGSKEVYLYHVWSDGSSDFVARFKYARPKSNAKAFAKFLAANFSVDEYFGKIASGVAPLMILKEKGYVSPNEKKAKEWDAKLKASNSAFSAFYPYSSRA
jgi:hypothetical protein